MVYQRTDLEQIVAEALGAKGLEFVEQYPTSSGFVLDFVLSPNIVLEVDGPCHDSSKSKRRDWFRTKCLIMEGWKVYRLGYKLINDSQRLSNKLDEILTK